MQQIFMLVPKVKVIEKPCG